MTREYATKTLAAATIDRDAARKAMEAAKPWSNKWMDAEETLNFYQGKVANMEAAVKCLDAGII